MIVKSIELESFRNYESLDMSFSPGINIIYGDNAQGKTNILEAVYFGCTTKSQRGSKESEIIKFGNDEAHLRLYVERKREERRIDMHLRMNKPKGVAIDGLPIKKSAEIYGLINIISFSPEDLGIVKNGPVVRRKFMDMELCQISSIYLAELSNYNKVLFQRNNLLKQLPKKPELSDTLDLWDEQLVNYGKSIVETRRKFVNDLNKIIYGIHFDISGAKERLSIKYEPDTSEEELEKKLFISREKDIVTGSTNVGPHRDDLRFFINGEDVRKFGSQGQQRTAALSLKLAEIEFVRAKTQDKPILLLDDVLSELDRNRQTRLLGNITGIQTIITCTGLEEFIQNRVAFDTTYKIQNGYII